jgi:hypothetical protein
MAYYTAKCYQKQTEEARKLIECRQAQCTDRVTRLALLPEAELEKLIDRTLF